MDETFAFAVGALWTRFGPQELERVAVLERAAEKGTLVLERERREAQEEAHRLAGTLAVLGKSAAATGARELEKRFLAGDLSGITPLLRELRAALEAPPLGSAP
jgi:HPt (histidine-containing phosphotransfer) domain-containing protein